MDITLTGKEVRILTRKIRDAARRHSDIDEWHRLSERFDLNLWQDGNDRGAAIYGVIDGVTVTDDWFDLLN